MNGTAEQQFDNNEESLKGILQLAHFSPFVGNCIPMDACMHGAQSWYRLAGPEKQNIEPDLSRKSFIESG